jgi:hydroxyacylglutathione hydrolase
VIEAPDESSIRLAGRELRFLDTPGHAKHHFCVHDPVSESLFTGDTFGLSYRELDQGAKVFIFPTTTPVQFDPPALHASIDRLVTLKPSSMYLTHYSRVGDAGRLAGDLHRLIDRHADLARGVDRDVGAEQRTAALEAGVAEIVAHEAQRQGGDPLHWQRVFVNDISLNAAGLSAWIERPR